MSNQRVTRSAMRSVELEVSMASRRMNRNPMSPGPSIPVVRSRRAATSTSGLQSLRRIPYPTQLGSSALVEPARLRGRPNSRSVAEREVPTEILQKANKLSGPQDAPNIKSVDVNCPPSPTLLPCPICFTEMFPSSGCPISSLYCGHVFCRTCLSKALTINSCCPICMAQVKERDVRPIYLQ